MIPVKSRTRRHIALALLCLGGLVGCGTGGVQPPSPKGLSLQIGNGSATFYRWQGGPSVLICHDVQGGSSSTGESGSGPPWIQKQYGKATAPDGRSVEWQLETTDGQKVQCRINRAEYDLAKGALFLVKTKHGKAEVVQFSRDLSAVLPDVESIKEFARKDGEVSKLFGTKAE